MTNKKRKKKKKKKKKDKKTESNLRMSWHHMIPRSRGGSNDKENKKRVALIFHRAWHHLFDNHTPEEVIYGLKSPSNQDYFIRNNKDKAKDWQVLFGKASIKKIIKIIKKEWSPQTSKKIENKK
ncbi:MAG: hypothetical protein KAS12_03020 [Candidatus Aenigmarchaeota archaeon]|nr:hypothetical protein [Candidatus Aenigmarchaeota archaeon]